jgi:hypothetical protein
MQCFSGRFRGMSGKVMTPSGTSPLLPGLHRFGRTGLVREDVGADTGLNQANDVGQSDAIGNKPPPTGFAQIR